MKNKEKDIAAAVEALKPLKDRLLKDLESARDDLDNFEAPSLASIGTVIGGIVVTAATGGAGLAAYLAGGSALMGVLGMGDDFLSTKLDAAGQRVNEDLILKRLDTC